MGGNKRGREEEKDDDEEEDSLAVREQEERRKEERAESVFEAQMRKKEEELKEVKEELRNLSPTPLWKIVTDKQYKDIFETHILSKLNDLSFRVFREVNTESCDACRRSGRKLPETLEVRTWSGKCVSGKPPEKKKETRKLEGKEAQRYFCSEAARMGNLALVRWLREVKKFDWNQRTISSAAYNACAHAAKSGHLDILKYLHENGAPWNSWTCTFARKYNRPECLLYALENGCQNDKHVPQQQQQ
ncbi:unnamed protein product [Bathycoccus prasinos]